MLKMIVFGTGAIAKEFLKKKDSYKALDIAGVVTERSDPIFNEFANFNISEFEKIDSPESINKIKESKPDVILSITSPFIFKEHWFDIPRYGIFNLHPSALPEFGGYYPYIWSIIKGADNHGVTIHKVTPQIDCGDITHQVTFPIEKKDTGLSLYMKCIKNSVSMMNHFIEDIKENKLEYKSQDLSKRSYYKKGIPLKGMISLDNDFDYIERVSRAFSFAPFPSPVGNLKIKINETDFDFGKIELTERKNSLESGKIYNIDNDKIIISCRDALFSVKKLNGKSAADEINNLMRKLNLNSYKDIKIN